MKKKLSRMRQLHLVHADIKPENILYSRGWKKIVLIDFGLAMFIKQLVNEEVETYFIGTPHFAGKEMHELYELKTRGSINLYRNDYQMLINTVNKLFCKRVSPPSAQYERTEDGYFIYKFGEIHDKFVIGKTSYRHIDPSDIEEEIGQKFITYEVDVEQDDTLHEKRFVFQYLHK